MTMRRTRKRKDEIITSLLGEVMSLHTNQEAVQTMVDKQEQYLWGN